MLSVSSWITAGHQALDHVWPKKHHDKRSYHLSHNMSHLCSSLRLKVLDLLSQALPSLPAKKKVREPQGSGSERGSFLPPNFPPAYGPNRFKDLGKIERNLIDATSFKRSPNLKMFYSSTVTTFLGISLSLFFPLSFVGSR